MRGKSSPSTLTPLQMLSPPEPKSDSAKRELQIVSTSPFRLPDDWFVEFKTRRNNTASPGRVDKYYHEPGTGRMFRSLIAVKRYLTEENQYTPTPETVKAGNENTMQIVVCAIKSTSHFRLPDDWVIEEKPRSNANYAGIIDKGSRPNTTPQSNKHSRPTTTQQRDNHSRALSQIQQAILDYHRHSRGGNPIPQA
ncbi:uncharacterized protein LOC115987742 isoform X3 [Quercus lobata]|uniref:uncharacterized protein LOC115987742 isoform X3 n=1 Tax=Quercus lobata TaxID=97700 RepID=UPI0012447914|nr:uncharacterized protein LOC115987742 isoform X3 [Quercus lobata]